MKKYRGFKKLRKLQLEYKREVRKVVFANCKLSLRELREVLDTTLALNFEFCYEDYLTVSVNPITHWEGFAKGVRPRYWICAFNDYGYFCWNLD